MKKVLMIVGSMREKLKELLQFMQVELMEGNETGVALDMSAFLKFMED